MCLEENFVYLNGKNVLYPKVSEIILNFIQKDEKNYNKLRNNLCQFKNIFQYVYSCLYPEVYCLTERRGFDLKSTFQLVFKTYKDRKKKIEQSSGKNLQNYVVERHESFQQGQKPVKIDDFNNEEEKIIKERVEKRKKKRKQVAEKNKVLKRPKKTRKEKLKKLSYGNGWKQ